MTDTIQILIDSRSDRTAACRILNGMQIRGEYYSRTAARVEFGNDDARYVVTTHPVTVRTLTRRLSRAGLTVQGG